MTIVIAKSDLFYTVELINAWISKVIIYLTLITACYNQRHDPCRYI
jgi:hypothetical protein